MTQKATIAAIRSLGLSVRVTDREYRITYKNIPADRAEAVAYYTNDADDALGTARIMADKGFAG